MADEHAKLGLRRGVRANCSSDGSNSRVPTLAELGIDHNESARLKALAETPAPILDAIR